jgi:hypothetical protein
MKKHNGKIVAATLIVLALTAAWLASGASGSKAGASPHAQKIDPATGKDKYLTDPVPEGKPIPVEPQDAIVGDAELTCVVSINCASILNNMDLLDKEKTELAPPDGIILPPVAVSFREGESAFDALKNITRERKIHLEFVNTPIYNSAYIEGINNIYEFDCGELSGWMFKVNGWFPNYGCSRYQLKAGDVIEWIYTCDLGRDIGGYGSTNGE